MALPKRTFTLPFAERFHALIEMQAADCAARGRVQRPCQGVSASPDGARQQPAPGPGTCRPMTDAAVSLTASAAFREACAVAAAPAVLTAVGALAAGCNWICR
ncbi:hypothetical protein [Streptomyces sp. NBC_00401]|uniref:hypothetical protein n=1 Tax=Streptomyces sp. NBC_00401 TaxID=2975738 RepID=UPI002256C0D9|nr:hypothetical protein [Streptomyces sp. NBC_00401]MCX5085456.1 hypothetical protein [Streptomyces sp. NBC_00401]